MSFNLANLPPDERQAIEDEKARLFEFWQRNNSTAMMEAERIHREKDKRKGKWADWAADQIDAISPPELQSLVKSALKKLG